MTVPIARGCTDPPFEDCCFCERPTSWWSIAQDVPVCPSCGQKMKPSDVPTKEAWSARCEREERKPFDRAALIACFEEGPLPGKPTRIPRPD